MTAAGESSTPSAQPPQPRSVVAALRQPLPLLTLLALLLVLLTALWQWRTGPPLSTDLTALLPTLQQTPLEQRAQQRVEQQLNERLLVLAGHPDPQQALTLAAAIVPQWHDCDCFERIEWRRDLPLDAVREQLLAQRLALLPAPVRAQLRDDPAGFLTARAEALIDPFGAGSLVAPEHDWLGLTRHVAQRPASKVTFDAASGAALIHTTDRTWVLLTAVIDASALDVAAPRLARDAVMEARALAQQAGGELLALGGVLHAAAARDQAAREVAWVGGGSVVGIVLLLLFAFRSPRALGALVPVLTGLLSGAVACVALFGEIHVLTLVLGASLIGVAIDYPLHYLSKSWLSKSEPNQPPAAWQSFSALRSTLPGLRLSLATSLIGYGALLFTPFPALTQIAVFSIAGLVAAFLVAICLLPALLATTRFEPTPALFVAARAIEARRQRLSPRLLLVTAAAVTLLTAIGMARLDMNNDVRQWVRSPPSLLAEARAIAELTGEQPTSQFFIVEGADADSVIARSRALGEQLAALVDKEALDGFRSIDQFIAPVAGQRQLQAQLPRLLDHTAPLLALGISRQQLQDEVTRLQSLPPVTAEQALAGPLGEPWRQLWLPTAAGEPAAALVTLSGLRDASALPALAAQPGVRYVDRLAALDAALDAVQWRAMLLKLISTLLLLLLVGAVIGVRPALAIVGLPFAAALIAAGVLGLLGQPLTLFGLFGLLLATAVGVDYAILMYERVGGMAVSLLGTVLAAATAWLSFGLLAVSQTPAVSNFGLAVTLGLAICLLLAPWAVPPGALRPPPTAQ